MPAIGDGALHYGYSGAEVVQSVSLWFLRAGASVKKCSAVLRRITVGAYCKLVLSVQIQTA